MSAAARPLTVAEVAREKGCSTRTVRRAIEDGDLAAVAVSPRLYLVARAAASQWTPEPRRGRPAKKVPGARRP